MNIAGGAPAPDASPDFRVLPGCTRKYSADANIRPSTTVRSTCHRAVPASISASQPVKPPSRLPNTASAEDSSHITSASTGTAMTIPSTA